jgi:DNA polymerase-3 subunit delta'
MIYSWQAEQWQKLQQADQGNRLPHALLFMGISGLGKACFADNFIRAKLCHHAQEVVDGLGCACHACRLIAGKTHPNVLWIEPEKQGSAIKVDQIREVSDFVNQTSMQDEYRFVVINPAEQMNVNAANALLKTLEEPAPDSILILITSQASHLPATILSRCQHIHFARPSTKTALAWLRQKISTDIDAELVLGLANGAPLAALQLAQSDMLAMRSNLLAAMYVLSQKQAAADPIKSAAAMQALDMLPLLDFTLSWVMDILRLKVGGSEADIVNKDFHAQISDLHQRSFLKNMTSYMDYLQQLRGQIIKGFNLNKQLMLEAMFIRWMECLECF